jgi:hypothetical protein
MIFLNLLELNFVLLLLLNLSKKLLIKYIYGN